jgi:hypothetical protein
MSIDMKALAREVATLIEDDKITSEESDRTVAALKLAIQLTRQQEDAKAEIIADYEDRLKAKDKQVVVLTTIIAGAIFGSAIMQYLQDGMDWTRIGFMLLQIGIGILSAILILFIKQRVPALLPKLKSATDILVPLVDPRLKQGLQAVGQIVDAVENAPQLVDTPAESIPMLDPAPASIAQVEVQPNENNIENKPI